MLVKNFRQAPLFTVNLPHNNSSILLLEKLNVSLSEVREAGRPQPPVAFAAVLTFD